ncbi:sarcosine oxidase subunit gamma [Streptomyces sp. NPDC051561]|uniref:sarcosine oxidase subunit gamma n=1 Tax=Streptomyces sp. NPDC051561 TaxID=3365658 RepID=UPI0037B50F0B
MADPALLAAATRSSGGALRLAALRFPAQIDVRLAAGSAAADAITLALGLPLPVEPNTTTATGRLTALWLGPDEWLVVGPPDTEQDLESRIRAAVAGGDDPLSVTDVSAQRAALLVSGPRARDLLAHGCPLDLHPRAFAPGHCARTTLARAHIVLVARARPRAGFWLLVRSSYARYVTDWLLDAATEYV